MRHPYLLLLCFATVLAAYESAPAEIITDGRTIGDAYVSDENLDCVNFVIGDPRSAVKSSLTRKQYKRIQYGDAKDMNYKTAEVFADRGEMAKAADSYRKAIDSASYQWVVERSYLRAVQCLIDPKVNKPDDGLKLADDFLLKFPKSVNIAELTTLRGDLRLAKGDLVGADADYAAIEKNADAWGVSRARAVVGRANVLRRGKKYTEALALIQPVFASSKADQDPEGWARLGMSLADFFHLAAQKDEAIKTLRLIAFSPASAPDRCAAHLRLAKVLMEGATGDALVRAFDHAVLAALLGADDAIDAEARVWVKKLAALIDKDKSLPEEDRKEYRDYARNL